MDSGVGALDGGCFYPPTDYTKWSNLIKAWATHENARYPNVESSWLWELWNEPDINYWHGTFADYAKLYDYTEAAVHQVLPNAQVGGPAVASAGGSFLTQFLQHCATGANALGGTGARLDLISLPRQGRRRHHGQPRRDEHGQPAAPASERNERSRGRGGVQVRSRSTSPRPTPTAAPPARSARRPRTPTGTRPPTARTRSR